MIIKDFTSGSDDDDDGEEEPSYIFLEFLIHKRLIAEF